MLKRICIHWTAGGLKASRLDINHYHFIVEGDGKIVEGVLKPEANVPRNGKMLTRADRYIPHCGGGNSFAIGASVCGAGHPKYKLPVITQKSMESLFKLVAELATKYGIPVTKDTVYTHYEFGLRNPRTPSRGKPDISVLSYNEEVSKLAPEEVGDFIRNKILWYQKNIGE